MPISAHTRLVALLGDPVHHSLSPKLQNAAFQAAGVDGVYLALPCNAPAVPHLIRAIAAAGGAGNITIPHKRVAIEAIDVPTEAVLRSGSCNTFWFQHGRVFGDNTDVVGFRSAARALLADLRDRQALLLGAGGAAAAVLLGLLDSGAGRVTVWNRTLVHARDLCRRLDPGGLHTEVVADRSLAQGHTFDLVVNATALGLSEKDPLPLDLTTLPPPGAALDLVYGRGGTAWTRQAAALGIPTADGTEMLLAQAAAAFEHWWPVPAPRATMRAVLSR